MLVENTRSALFDLGSIAPDDFAERGQAAATVGLLLLW